MLGKESYIRPNLKLCIADVLKSKNEVRTGR